MVIAACLATAYGAYVLAGYAWDQVVDYKSPYVRQAGAVETSPTTVWVPATLQPSFDPSAPVLAKRLVLVIVDGMRDDVSRSEMNTLNKLRTYGADVDAHGPAAVPELPELDDHPHGSTARDQRRHHQLVREPSARSHPDGPRRSRAAVASRSSDPRTSPRCSGSRSGSNVSLRPWPKGGYLTSTLVDDALRIAKSSDPQLIVVHLPDLDEAGHSFGGGSKEYREVAHKIDLDLARLVDGLQREDTAFIVVADHGHIDTGGHGGWEQVATTVPGVFAGAGIKLGPGEGRLEQIAPTVSVLSGHADSALRVSGRAAQRGRHNRARVLRELTLAIRSPSMLTT